MDSQTIYAASGTDSEFASAKWSLSNGGKMDKGSSSGSKGHIDSRCIGMKVNKSASNTNDDVFFLAKSGTIYLLRNGLALSLIEERKRRSDPDADVEADASNENEMSLENEHEIENGNTLENSNSGNEKAKHKSKRVEL